jgi:hypothetical protein
VPSAKWNFSFHKWAKKEVVFILLLWHRAMVVKTLKTRINQQAVVNYDFYQICVGN